MRKAIWPGGQPSGRFGLDLSLERDRENSDTSVSKFKQLVVDYNRITVKLVDEF